MFESRKDLTARISQLEEELKQEEAAHEENRQELKKVQEEAAQAAQDLDAEKKAHEETRQSLEGVIAERDEAAAERDEADKKLESFEEVVAGKVKAEVALQMEKLGHPALELEPSGDDPSGAEQTALKAAETVSDDRAFEHFGENAEDIKKELFAGRAR